MGFYVKPSYIQVYLRDIAGSFPDHHSRANCNLFAGRDSCLQFVKNSTFVTRSKAKCNQTRYVCTGKQLSDVLTSFWGMILSSKISEYPVYIHMYESSLYLIYQNFVWQLCVRYCGWNNTEPGTFPLRGKRTKDSYQMISKIVMFKGISYRAHWRNYNLSWDWEGGLEETKLKHLVSFQEEECYKV